MGFFKRLHYLFWPDPSNFSFAKDGMKIRSNFHAYLYGPDGELKEERHVHNLIPTAGCNHVANRMSGLTDGPMTHMAVGTDNTPAAAGDTTLGVELDRNALAGKTQNGGGIGQHGVRYEAQWAAGDGTGALCEAGIFNAAAAGTLLARVVYSVINKGAADTLDVDWDLSFADDGIP